jgi:HD-GYP domain-containing protein (c-di-GMP phosphodiesterase class II)
VAALLALSDAIEARDPYTRGHSARVSSLALEVGRRLNLDAIRLDALRLGGMLHDVGKLVIPDAVLRKPGPLTTEERAEVQAHPEVGARLVGLIRPLRAALPGVLYHHERWDGLGYPTGRAGAEIPLEARILAVVDSYDAMTSDRPYRSALCAADAADEVGRCAGSQFDPDVALAFLDVLESGVLGTTAALRALAS